MSEQIIAWAMLAIAIAITLAAWWARSNEEILESQKEAECLRALRNRNASERTTEDGTPDTN
jgi:hypothetical protein